MRNNQNEKLPTLAELVARIKAEEKSWFNSGGWAKLGNIPAFPEDVAWDFPWIDFYNNADSNKFIVVQTQLGRHILKPNLRYHPFIFRGQSKEYDTLSSSFYRDEKPDKNGMVDKAQARKKHLMANLKVEEFTLLLRRHPIFMLLDRGIVLYPETKPLYINMDYYGLAQHYGFKTGVLDFTTDIDCAAFFACTKYKGNDVYEPVTDAKAKGVIYMHEIIPNLTFKYYGFTTIGLQLYPRSGRQSGILYNDGMVSMLPLSKKVITLRFRHDASVSRHYFEKYKNGQMLFPKDGISNYAKEILSSKDVPGEVFSNNLYVNCDNLEKNLNAVEEFGYRVNWHVQRYFTDEMLNQVFQDLQNGLWEQFCNQIYFADGEKGRQMHESILNLPKNDVYKNFFSKDEFYKIINVEMNRHIRANNNFKRKLSTK